MKNILATILLVVLSTTANAQSWGSSPSYTERYLQKQKDDSMFGSSNRSSNDNDNSRSRSNGWQQVPFSSGSSSSSGGNCIVPNKFYGC